MQFVVLKIIEGPETGKKLTIRSGQRAHIGRSPRADFSLAQDASLADFHFVLDCTRGRCDFQLIEGSVPGLFGDQELASETLFDGDRFQVGASVFDVEIVGQTHPGRSEQVEQSTSPPEDAPPPPPPASGFAKVDLATAELVLEKMPDPPDEIIAVQESDQTPRALFEKLVESGSPIQAIQFLTFALPQREAVWALVTAIEILSADALSPAAQSGLESAKHWALDPTEENRRQAERQSNVLKMKNPAGYAAQAAFWSEGSMAPVGETEVPVLESLCHNMVNAGVIQLAGTQGDFEAALGQIIEHWTAVADGEASWK